ncbi:MAG: diguanylate cyclase [Deltaproteobacteria bacterium]|nr:diguanylate cyclase [Deltaproteobacteria bacterium]
MISPTILVISGFPPTVDILKRTLVQMGRVIVFDHLHSALDLIYNETPLLMIVDLFEEPETIPLLNSLKEDPLFAGVPVLVILDEEHTSPDWESIQADDYIRRQFIEQEILTKTRLCVLRSKRVVEVNPLTRLPGNIAINRQIQSRIDNRLIFTLGYVDLDHFKPFNDKYGFSRGDDVIRITGRLILNIVKGNYSQGSFVGHIGGDDFIFITEPLIAEDVCRDLIGAFDHIIPSFYDEEDRQAGFIQSKDRKGHLKRFPFLSITIGVVYVNGLHFTHYGEVTEIASEMKQYAKKQVGSCYKMNCRSYDPQEEGR